MVRTIEVARAITEREGDMRKGSWRVALAAVVVAGGLFGLTPSFDFDSDSDGIEDSTEVYELGTDPSRPDLHQRAFVASAETFGSRR